MNQLKLNGWNQKLNWQWEYKNNCKKDLTLSNIVCILRHNKKGKNNELKQKRSKRNIRVPKTYH